MGRTLGWTGLVAMVVFAGGLLLPADSAEASKRSGHKVSSGSSFSVGLHFGSGRSSLRHELHGDRFKSSLRHGLYDRRFRVHDRAFGSSWRHRNDSSFRHRLHDRSDNLYRGRLGHRGYSSFHYPRRRLLDRHYRRFDVWPPSSRSYFYYRYYDRPGVSPYSYRYDLYRDLPRAGRDRYGTDRDYRYRDAWPRVRSEPRDYKYPYLDEGDDVAAGGGTVEGEGPKVVDVRRGTGWDLLRTGNAPDARNVFGRQVEVDPGFAPAHLGYALALAEEGDYVEAVDSMRTGVLLDPAALTALPLDESLAENLREHIERIDATEADVSAEEAAFFRGAMHSALGEVDAARSALEGVSDESLRAASTLREHLDALDEG